MQRLSVDVDLEGASPNIRRNRLKPSPTVTPSSSNKVVPSSTLTVSGLRFDFKVIPGVVEAGEGEVDGDNEDWTMSSPHPTTTHSNATQSNSTIHGSNSNADIASDRKSSRTYVPRAQWKEVAAIEDIEEATYRC